MIDAPKGDGPPSSGIVTTRDEAARRFAAQHRRLAASGEQWMSQFVTLLARADAVARGVVVDGEVDWVGLLHVPRDADLAGASRVVRHVVAKSTPLWVEDVSSLWPSAGELLSMGWRAIAALPIVFHDHVIGAVVLGYHSPWVWTAHERRVLESWSQQGRYVREAIDAAIEDERERWRAVEARHRMIFESAPSGVLLADREGKILMANGAFARIVGAERGDLIGRSALDFIATPASGPMPIWIREWLRGNGGSRAAEVGIRRPDGETRTVRLSAIGLPASGSERALAIAIVDDVTEHRAIQQSLRDHEVQLRQAQKMESVGQLAGGLAHDFNNTLAVILGLASLLKEALPEGEQCHEDAVEILNITQRASGITRRLLQLSRGQRTQVERVDLHEMLREFEAVARKMLPTSIHLATIAVRGPVWVRADRSQLEQVLMNLVINARDAMPRGGRVTIELHVVEASLQGRNVEPCARISVADSGTGIAEEQLAKIWEPFFTTKGAAGTGLGLPTSKSIVREYGGELSVMSRIGFGTTFTMTLAIAPAETGLLFTTADLLATPAAARGAGRTILLAEDEEHVRATTRRMLERAGYRVIVARHGEDAWLRFLEFEGDIAIVVTDLVMPELSGALLVARIRERSPGIPVVGLSGYSGDEWRKYADSVAPLLVVQKPFTSEELVGAVARAFESGGGSLGDVMRARASAPAA